MLINIIVKGQSTPDIDKVDNAVVIVMIYDYKGNQVGHGSGFIIDDKGTVVTNYHNVKGASSLKVKIDNNGYKETYEVENIICGDPDKDLAKISLKNPYSKKFPFLTLSKTFPTKGEDCWAIGTPTEEIYMNTVSKGLISNINQYSDPKTLQTNAEISHGSSGGALINSKGEVIGVTSAGDGSDDGARASINFAIWIGELNNLPIINKKSVVDPVSVPCQLGFYTNSPYTGNVYLYIDGIYVGSFSKYFQNNYTPTCAEDGTITRNLYSGTYSYQVYFANTGQWYYGTVTLNPGQCQIFRVGGVTPTYTPKVRTPRKDIENKYKYKWMLSTGWSTVNTGRGYPFSFFLERYFYTHKISLRGNFQYLQKWQNFTKGYTYDLKYYSYGLDFKRVFTKANRNWNWYIAGSFNLRTVIKDYSKPQFVNNGVYETSYIDSITKSIGFVPLFRTGAEIHITKRFCLDWNTGIGFNTATNNPLMEFNFLLGYRLFAKREE